MRLTSTRWPISSVGTIDSLGMRYGLTRNAWMPRARPSAPATITPSPPSEPPADPPFPRARGLPVDRSCRGARAMRPTASGLVVGGGRVAGGGGLGRGDGLRRRHLDAL